MQRIAVFFGGNSNEHEISVITGMLCANLLRGAEYDVLPVYITRENALYTGEMRAVTDFTAPSAKWKELRFCTGGLEMKKGHKKFPVDVALNCCHGGAGEDGTLSALFEWHKIKSASPNTAVSSVFMDKTLTKIAARGMGLPVLGGVTVREGDEACSLPFPFPVIVKPAKLGSSIGIGVAASEEELKSALSLAFTLDDAALIEPYMRGKRDLNCAACRIGGKITLSPVEEVFSHEDILSFKEKYEEGGGHSGLPADIPGEIAEKVQSYTEKLYDSFRVTGVVRADFLLVGGDVYFNELNTVPGSLSCYLFGPSLTDSKNFLVSLAEEGLRGGNSSKPTVTTGILNSSVFTGKGGKRAPRPF